MKSAIEALEPLFKKIIKHALDGRTTVIDKQAKKRLRTYLQGKYNDKSLSRFNGVSIVLAKAKHENKRPKKAKRVSAKRNRGTI